MIDEDGIIRPTLELTNEFSELYKEITAPISEETKTTLGDLSRNMHSQLTGDYTPESFSYGRNQRIDERSQSLEQGAEDLAEARLLATPRTRTQVAGDTAVSLGKGVISLADMVYGTADLAVMGAGYALTGETGASLDNVTGNVSETLNTAREYLNTVQSEELQAQRRDHQRQISMYDEGAEQRLAARAIAAGRSDANVWDKALNLKDEAWNAFKETLTNPAVLLDTSIESGLSFLVPGAAATGLRKAGLGIIGKGKDLAKSKLTKSEISKIVQRENAAIGTVSIGLMEGSSNANEARLRVYEMSHEELLESSDVYQNYLEKGFSEEQAKNMVANNVFATTFGVAGAIAAASGLVTGASRLEAGLFRNATATGLVKGSPRIVGGTALAAIQETGQEVIQSGGGEFGQNVGLSKYADRDQDLLDSVGSSAGIGAASAGATAGTITGISRTAQGGVGSLGNVASNVVKAAARDTIQKETVKTGRYSQQVKDMLNPNSKTFNPSAAIEQMLDRRVLRSEELQTPEKLSAYLNQVNQTIHSQTSPIIKRMGELHQAGQNNTKEFQELSKEFKKLDGHGKKIVSHLIDNDSTVGLQNTIKQVIDEVATSPEQLTDETVENVFSIFGSSPELFTDAQLETLASSSNEEVSTLASNRIVSKQIEERLGALSKVNNDVLEGGPGFFGIKNYRNMIAASIKLGDNETAKEQVAMLAQFALRHTQKHALAEDILSGLREGEDVSALQNEYTEKYSTYDAKGEIERKAYVDQRSAKLVETIGLEVDALNSAVNELGHVTSNQFAPKVSDSQSVDQLNTWVNNNAQKTDSDSWSRLFGLVETLSESAADQTTRDAAKEVLDSFPEDITDTPISVMASSVSKLKQTPVTTAVEPSTVTEGDVSPTVENAEARVEKDTAALETKQRNKRASDYAEAKAVEFDALVSDIRKAHRLKLKETDMAPIRAVFASSVKADALQGRTPRMMNNSVKAFFQGIRDAFNGINRVDVKNPWYASGLKLAQQRMIPANSATERMINRLSPNAANLEARGIFKAKKTESKLANVNNYFQSLLDDPTQQEKLSEEELVGFRKFTNFHAKYVEAVNKRVTVHRNKGTETHKDVHKFIRDFGFPADILADPSLTLRNVNGEFDENVITAMAVAAYGYINDNQESFNGHDDATVRGLLGMDRHEDLPKEDYVEYLRNLGSIIPRAKDSIGEEVMSLLGLGRLNDSLTPEMYDKTTAAFGMMALDLLASNEVGDIIMKGEWRVTLEAAELSHKEGASFSSLLGEITQGEGMLKQNSRQVYFGRFKEGQNTFDSVSRSTYRDTLDNFFGWQSERPLPSFKPNTFTQKLMRRTRQQIPQQVKNAVQKLMLQPAYTKKDFFGVMNVLGKDNTLRLFGYASEEDINNQHILQRSNISNGRNPAILRDYEAAMDFALEAEDRSFYYDHMIAINMRTHLVGAINPQESKMHRYLFGYRAQEVTIKKSHRKQRKLFKLAVAQAFDISVDGQSNRESLNQLNKLLAQQEIIDGIASMKAVLRDGDIMEEGAVDAHNSKIMAAVEYIQTDGGRKPNNHEAGGAILDGLINMSRYSDTEAFVSDITLETDGKTNGPILAQLATITMDNYDEAKQRLNAGGIYFSGDPWKNFAEYKKAGNQDTYQFLGAEWLSYVHDQDDMYPGILGDISKSIRNLAKDPTMVTVYGSSVKTAVRRAVDVFYDSVYERLMDPETNKETALALKALGIKTSQHQRNVINTNGWGNFVFNKSQEEKIKNHINNIYGESLKNALDIQYGDFRKKQATINMAIRFMFGGFRQMYDLKVEEALSDAQELNPGQKALNEIEKEQILDDLIEVTPIIKTFFSSGLAEGYMAVKRQREELGAVYETVKSYNEPIEGLQRRKRGSNDTSANRSHTGEPSRMEFINAGVGGFVVSIHTMDAAIMTLTYAEQDVLGVHDAAITGVGNALETGQLLNKNFFNVTMNHDLVGSVYESTKRVYDYLDSVNNPSNLNSLMDIAFEDAGPYNQANDINEFMGQLAVFDKSNTEARQQLLGEMEYVGQYYLEDAVIDLKTKENVEELTAQTRLPTYPVEYAEEVVARQRANVDKLTAPEEQEFGSSPENMESFTPDTVQEIGPETSQTLLDQLLAQDGSTNSLTHQDQLRSVLDRVINPVVGKVLVEIQNMAPTTKGRYLASKNTVQLSTADPIVNDSQQTQSEVYVHELLHAVLHMGLQQNSVAKNVLMRFYAVARKHMTVEDMYPANATDAEKAKAQSLYDYIFNNTDQVTETRTDPVTGRKIEYNRNVALHEFLSFAGSNQRFIEALAKPEIIDALAKQPRTGMEPRTSKGGALPQLTTKLTNWVMSKISELFNFIEAKRLKIQGLAPHEAIMVLAEQIARIQNSNTENVYKESLQDKLDSKTKEGMMRWIYEPLAALGRSDFMASEKIPVLNHVTRAIAPVLAGLDGSRSPALAIEMIRELGRRMGVAYDGFFTTIAREMVGQHSGNRVIYALLRESKVMVDQTSKRTAVAMKDLIQKSFVTEYTNEEASASTRVLMNLDLSSLLVSNQDVMSLNEDGFSDVLTGPQGEPIRVENLERIKRIIEDGVYRTDEIKRMEHDLDQMVQDPAIRNYIKTQIKGLAHTMNGEMGKQAAIQSLNAHMIATLTGSDYAQPVNWKEIEVLVDRLTSIRAVDFADAKDLQLTSELWTRELDEAGSTDVNGMAFLLQLHAEYKNESKDKLFNGNPMLIRKGYTRQLTDPRVTIEIGTLADEKNLAKRGYKIHHALVDDQYITGSKIKGKVRQYVYVSRHDYKGNWQKTAINLTDTQTKGSSVSRDATVRYMADNGLGQNVEMVGEIDVNKLYQSKLEAQRNEIRTGAIRNGNSLIPLFDDRGKVVDFRYEMADQYKRDIFKRQDSFEDVLPQMFSHMVNKMSSTPINKRVIDELRSIYDTEWDLNPSRFIRVAADAKQQTTEVNSKRHKEYEEMWNMLPAETQAYAQSVFPDGIMIPDDMYKIVFGQRKVNIRDITQKAADNALARSLDKEKGDLMKASQHLSYKAFQHINTFFSKPVIVDIESGWKELVAMGKDVVVIKLGGVLMANIISNTAVLGVYGVPPKDILKYHTEGYKAVREYQEDVFNIDQISQQLKVSRSLTPAQRKQLLADKVFHENRLAENPARELLDSGVYQSIVEDVSLEDDPFTFKSTLEEKFEPLTSKAPQFLKDVGNSFFITHDTQMYKALRNTTQVSDFVARYTLHKHNMKKGMDFGESVNEIMDSFIDYETPTHDGLQYANDIGLVMFTKFFLRIQKVLFKMFKDRPASVLSGMVLQNMLAHDIPDVFDTGIWDPQNSINRMYSPLDTTGKIMGGNMMNFDLMGGLGRPM